MDSPAGAALLMISIVGVTGARADGFRRSSGYGSRGGIHLDLNFGNRGRLPGGYGYGGYGYENGYRADRDDRFNNHDRGFLGGHDRRDRDDRRNGSWGRR